MYVQIVHGTLYTEKIVQCTMYCTTVVHNTAVVFILLTFLSYAMKTIETKNIVTMTRFSILAGLEELIEEGRRQKKRQRSSRLFRGQNIFNSLPP